MTKLSAIERRVLEARLQALADSAAAQFPTDARGSPRVCEAFENLIRAEPNAGDLMLCLGGEEAERILDHFVQQTVFGLMQKDNRRNRRKRRAGAD